MSGPTRSCVVCRSEIDRDGALRIVLGPDDEARVDWRKKLPGRGASVCWRRACLDGLSRSGGLNRAFRQEVSLPGPSWALDEARRYLLRRQTELTGLAARAGELKAGGNLVERLVRKGWPKYLIRSADAGETVAADWGKRAKALEMELFPSALDSRALGDALGKTGPRSILAVNSGPLGAALRTELKRGLALL